MIKEKIIKITSKKENLLIFVVLSFIFFINLSIKLKTSLFIVFLGTLIYYFDKRETKINLNISLNKYIIVFLFFCYLIITQNTYLNYEIISIDVPSYLVASQNVSFSELPFEKQWESKGPLFLYMYKTLSLLSFKNLVVFKLLNDLLLFFIALVIYEISSINSKNSVTAIFSTLIFLSITSHVWYVSELSEIYCLIFITFQYYLLTKYELNKKIILFSSFLISLSSLVNQASAIFLIGLVVMIILNDNLRNKLANYFYIVFAFLIPHLFFIIIYASNNLLNVYFTNYIKIPFGYVDSGNFEIYELVVWLRRYFIYNEFLFFSILTVGVILFKKLISKNNKNNNLYLNLIYLILSFSIYVIAGHNYQHHLFYSIVFLSILISHFEVNKSSIFLYLLIVIAAFQIFVFSFTPSTNNLKSLENTFENYPLYQLAKEIDSQLDSKDFDILAIDHLLLLYYLEKPNTSYIIHPYNNFEEYIVQALTQTGLLKTNEYSHLSYYIELEPDVIVCTPQAIINGFPTNVGSEFFNCEITDYKKNYYQFNTDKYLNNPNRDYYHDPYVEIDLFIKKP